MCSSDLCAAYTATMPSLPSSTPARGAPRSLTGLLPFLRPYRARIALSLVFLVLAALATLAFPMALRNLISNAIRYSPSNTHVGVGVRRVNGTIEVTVTDQGPGIAEADQQRIFERFYRADPARSRETGGTGLGLAIVKHVCANHGGECTVWSRIGQGSTFTLHLDRKSTRLNSSH